MTTGKRRYLYISYIIGTALIFSYLLFPSNTIKEYLSNQVYKANPSYRMNIADLSPSFPPSLLLKGVHLFEQNGLIFNADHLKLFPKWLSLFSSKRGVKFKGTAYQGHLNGTISSIKTENGKYPSLMAEFSDMSLMLVPWFQERFDLDISGALSGKIRYEQKTIADRSGSVNADIVDCAVSLANPLFDLGELEFSEIKVVAALKNDTIEIQQGLFDGNQMTGSLSGEIVVQSPAENSQLKVSIKVKPDRVFLSNLSGVFSVFLSSDIQKENEEMIIKITGTLGKPQVSFQ
jgi:type II secretion system protein N